MPLQRATEPQELLLFARRHPDRVQRRQMILRQLAQVRVGGGNDRDDLGQRGEGDACPAIGLWHGDSPKARPRETIELLGRKGPLAVPLRRALREIGGKPACDGQRFLVGGDTMRVRVEFESRRLLRERDWRSDIFIHDGS
jgi:hypothetical protein